MGASAQLTLHILSLPGSRLMPEDQGGEHAGDPRRLGTLSLVAFPAPPENAGSTNASSTELFFPTHQAPAADTSSSTNTNSSASGNGSAASALLRIDSCPAAMLLDSTIVSLHAPLVAGCTLFCSPARISFLASGVPPTAALMPRPTGPGEVAGADTGVTVSASRPLLRIRNNHAAIVLRNPSPFAAAHYRIESRAFRRSGMRLRLGDDHVDAEGTPPDAGTTSPPQDPSQDDRDRDSERGGERGERGAFETYDTVQVAPAEPPEVYCVEAGGAVTLGWRLVPGSSSPGRDSVAASLAVPWDGVDVPTSGTTGGSAGLPSAHALIALPILIFDLDAPHHPPARLLAVLEQDTVPAPALVTAPVSATNRIKQQLSHVSGLGVAMSADKSSPGGGGASGAAGLDWFPGLVLRGVTPLSQRGNYEITLGQQAQRKDCIEWLLTIENPSAVTALCSIAATTSDDWVMLGQNRGRIEAKGSLSVSCFPIPCFNYAPLDFSRYGNDVFRINFSRIFPHNRSWCTSLTLQTLTLTLTFPRNRSWCISFAPIAAPSRAISSSRTWAPRPGMAPSAPP